MPRITDSEGSADIDAGVVEGHDFTATNPVTVTADLGRVDSVGGVSLDVSSATAADGADVDVDLSAGNANQFNVNVATATDLDDVDIHYTAFQT